MLCRALTAAVAVTYVICVLILSGMQKEDLDAGMLTKLQRYNVNIDDTNNEELLQMCTNTRKNKNNNSDITITESQTRDGTIKNTFTNFKTNKGSNNLKRLHITDNDSYYFSTEHKNKNELQENDNALKKNIDENKLNFDKIIQDNDRQTKVESLLQYWKNVRTNETAKMPDITKEPDSKKSITDSLHSIEENTLNKLITNFILRRNNSSTLLTTTTQKTTNIDDLFDKLYALRMQDMRKNYNSIGEFERGFAHSPIQRNVGKSAKEREIGSTKEKSHINRKNLTDILSLVYQDADMIRNLNERTKQRSKWTRNPNLINFERLETVDTTNTTRPTNVEAQHEISRNMIKEIADSVKEIVLRDLRKELHKTTDFVVFSSSATTTIKSTNRTESSTREESVTQTAHKEDNTKTQESVMKKFLELFEEIKSLRQNSIVLTSDSEKDINSKEIRPKELQVFSQVRTPHNIPNVIRPFYANQAYGINQYPVANLGNNFNFAPQLLNHKSNRTITTEKPKKLLNKAVLPITVQTNNIEIPPLGIPLAKPQNIISQNIIITTITKVPYRIVSSTNNNNSNGSPFKNRNSHIGNQSSNTNKHFMEYKSKQINPRLTKEQHKFRSHNFRPNNKDNVIRLTLNNNAQSDYNADYYEKINIGKYYSNLNSEEIKHQEIPRYHEQLEKVERYQNYPEQEKYVDYPERYSEHQDQNNFADNNDCCNKKFRYSQAMVDCCNRKIASRQQISINNMKKKSYDDTHFKKFLQSQQKVTDMLERILGDKEKVHSVETA